MAVAISSNLFTFLIMNKQTTLVWILLVLLTVAVGVISSLSLNMAVILILLLSSLKFIGVTFYFMELKKAHIFWKVSILMYLSLFSILAYNFL